MSVRRDASDAGDGQSGGAAAQPTPVPIWRNSERDPAAEAPAYAVGDTVISGTCRGTVVSVGGDEYANISVAWSENDKPITYPADAPYLRKSYPWETNQK